MSFYTSRLSKVHVGRLTIRALVLAVLVDVLELFERLDDVQVLAVGAVALSEGNRSRPKRGSAEKEVNVPEVVYDVF